MVLKIHWSRKRSPLVRRSPKVRLRQFLSWPLVFVCLWWGYQELQGFWSKPEAIFVLGGHENRERYAALLAARHPELPVWVSSGSPKGYSERIFRKAGVDLDRLHLDYRAKDTVTNFTTLVDELKAQGIDSVYLVTSDNHMERASIVGEIIFGSRGIHIKPITVPSQASPEPTQKCWRDGARALLWLATGSTGESLTTH